MTFRKNGRINQKIASCSICVKVSALLQVEQSVYRGKSMKIFPNKFMSSLGGFGVWLKRKCLGKDSVIRDLTKGDKGDISFDAKSFKFFSTKESLDSLAREVLSSVQKDPTLPTEAFAGKFLTVVSASRCLKAEDIKSIVTNNLGDSNTTTICKAALKEFVAEATFSSQTEEKTFKVPNQLWKDRVSKFIKAYPDVLEQEVEDTSLPSKMTFQKFLLEKLNFGNTSPSQPSAASAPSRTREISYRAPFRPQDCKSQEAKTICTKVNQKLESHRYSEVALSREESRFDDIPLVNSDNNLVEVTVNGDRKLLHANRITLNGLKFIFMQMFTEATQPRALQFFSEADISCIVDLTKPGPNGDQRLFKASEKYYPEEGERIKKEAGETGKRTRFAAIRGGASVLNESSQTITDSLVIKDNKPPGKEKDLSRLNYTNWTDHKSVDSMTEFDSLVEQVSSFVTDEIPTVIHCRAGVGRSGTLATAIVLHKIAEKREVAPADIINCITQGRVQRGSMFVQKGTQLDLLVAYKDYLNKK